MAKSRSKRPQQDFTRYHEKLKAEARAARDTSQSVRFCTATTMDRLLNAWQLQLSHAPAWSPVHVQLRISCKACCKSLVMCCIWVLECNALVHALPSLNRSNDAHSSCVGCCRMSEQRLLTRQRPCRRWPRQWR